MTSSFDLDRALASFLEEGPVRVPDRPVEAALAHARSHPRRGDPFAPLRRDPMARRSGWSASPALVLAVLALLVALSTALYVGTRPQQPSIVPPVPTPSAGPSTPVVSRPPSPSPSPSAAPSSAAPTPPAEVQVVDGNGQTATVEIVDGSGLLVDADGFPPDPERAQNAEIEAIQLPADEGAGERAIIVMWVDLSCPGPHRLTIDETASSIVLETRSCPSDAMGVDHQLVLTFAEPVVAAELELDLVRIPAGQ